MKMLCAEIQKIIIGCMKPQIRDIFFYSIFTTVTVYSIFFETPSGKSRTGRRTDPADGILVRNLEKGMTETAKSDPPVSGNFFLFNDIFKKSGKLVLVGKRNTFLFTAFFALGMNFSKYCSCLESLSIALPAILQSLS